MVKGNTMAKVAKKTTVAAENTGKIIQILGAVVDVAFDLNHVPEIYSALKVPEAALTLEVQQQIGDGVVRTIAMGSTDGLKRNLVVENTGNPITVPVGKKTLGRKTNSGKQPRRAVIRLMGGHCQD